MRAANEAAQDERLNAKSEIARALIDAMKIDDTPWQRSRSAKAMLPENATTSNAYRGVNRIILALSGGVIASRTGKAHSRWVTFCQA